MQKIEIKGVMYQFIDKKRTSCYDCDIFFNEGYDNTYCDYLECGDGVYKKLKDVRKNKINQINEN